MDALKIFALVWLAMVATSFWEAYAEGDKPWDEDKIGWKIRRGKYVVLTAYHFWLFWVMFPALLAIPLVLDFSWRLFGIVLSAYASGLVIEDFFWFVVNPKFPFRNFRPEKVYWYPWLHLGNVIAIPVGYLFGTAVAVLSWFLLWR